MLLGMARRQTLALFGALVVLAVLSSGCSSIVGSAVRTGPLHLPPHFGAVAVFAAAPPPAGAELGVVEVHASQMEANVETLVPLFVQKVAALGGNAAVIDRVSASIEYQVHPYIETYSYACGYRSTCVGTRTSAISDEILTLSVAGRALSIGEASAPRVSPAAGGR